MQVRLRGIHTVKRRLANGTLSVHFYHRASRTKLEGKPGSAEFMASFAIADKIRIDRLGDTFAGLVRKFEESSDFAKTADSTRREYRRKFRVIDVAWGTCPAAALTEREFRRDVLEWRDKLALRAPREADNLVSAIARVLAFGVDRGTLTSNVLAHFSRAYRSNRSDKIWHPAQITAFNKIAAPELRAAMLLALHTGQRQGDLLRLRWTDYDGKSLSLRQSKTGTFLTIPCTADVRVMLDGLSRPANTILTNHAGLPWSSYHFRHHWAAAAKSAGIEGLHFHDLRGTAITALAEAGATVPEIASITGHKLEHVGRILESYLARTSKLSGSAIAKLDRHLRRNRDSN